MPDGTHISPIQQVEADISAFIASFGDFISHHPRWGQIDSSHGICVGIEAAQNEVIRRAFEKWPDTLEFFALRITVSKSFLKSFQRGLKRGLSAKRTGEKINDRHNVVGCYLPAIELQALTSTKNYGAYKQVHKDIYNRVLLRVLTNPPTEEAIREHLFLGTIFLALTGETRYFHTLWRSARLVFDFMHTPAQQLYKQALPLF